MESTDSPELISMPEFEAQIKAGKLKHVANVLRRVNDEAIFEITDDKLMCRLADAANAIMVQVTLPRAAFDLYDVDDMRIGVDLDRLGRKVLKRATAKDTINIFGDENEWQFVRGIHQKSVGLLNPERLRKAPRVPVLSHTVEVRLSGKTFKDIVAEAADYNDRISIRATSDALTIEAETKDMKSERYKCTLPANQYYEMFEGDAQSIYAVKYLHDIAAGMKAHDGVTFRFSTDMPGEIEYERDGVSVGHMLAPRITAD